MFLNQLGHQLPITQINLHTIFFKSDNNFGVHTLLFREIMYTDRQRDRQADKQTDKQTDKRTDKFLLQILIARGPKRREFFCIDWKKKCRHLSYGNTCPLAESIRTYNNLSETNIRC